MGLISPFTLIRTISLFHLTAAYLFLTNPRMITDQNVVFMLGESMRLPHATALDKPNDASAFIAVILAFLGISDLAAAGLNETTSLLYWLANVPVRIFFLFGITGYAYLFKQGGMFGPTSAKNAGVGENLQNSLVFTWGFFELAWWFWVFTSLRDERREIAKRDLIRLRASQDSL